LRVFKILAVCLTGLMLWGAAPSPDPYLKVETKEQLNEVFLQVKTIAESLGLSLKFPIEAVLVSEQKLDELYKGPYRGMEVGLHTMKNGNHSIMIMQGEDRDMTGGILAHEYGHAWEMENCSPAMNQVFREGFAEWLKYKYYDQVGAYRLMEEMREVQDPVYGEGFKRVLEWEDKYGVEGVLNRIKKQ